MYSVLGIEITSNQIAYVRYQEFLELKQDPSSIVHYTNAFDQFLIEGILPKRLKAIPLPDEYSSIDNVWLQNLARKYNEYDHPWIHEVVELLLSTREFIIADWTYLKNMFNFLSNYAVSFFFDEELNYDVNAVVAFYCHIILFISKHFILVLDSLLAYLKFDNILVTNTMEFIFSFDIFLVLFELIIVLYIFFFSKKFFTLKSLNNKFYDDIINFFKINGLSYVEITSVITIFFFFIIGDIILSFGEDCYFDNLFFGIIIFLVLCLFLLLLSLDIKYFYSMNSVSSNSVNLRTLIFDIFNNFISLLRIFLCWIRYIIYDIQVDLVDLNYFYLDYNNDIKYIFKNYHESTNSVNFLTFVYNYISAITIFVLDIFFILFQIVICVFKLFIAFYILWLILDLFFFKILNHKELKRK